eukprot:3280870-Alexandrium_andersonii.AAC.1
MSWKESTAALAGFGRALRRLRPPPPRARTEEAALPALAPPPPPFPQGSSPLLGVPERVPSLTGPGLASGQAAAVPALVPPPLPPTLPVVLGQAVAPAMTDSAF